MRKPTTSRKAFGSLSRGFWLVVIGGTTLTLAMLVGLYEWHGRQQLMQSETRSDSRFVRVVGNLAWPLVQELLKQPEATARDKLKRLPQQDSLRTAVTRAVQDSDVLKVRLYAPATGRVLFSTNASQIGELRTDSELQGALGGQFSSQLERRLVLNPSSGLNEERDVFTSFLPYYATDAAAQVKKPSMIVEVHSDVSQRMTDHRRDGFVVAIGVGLTTLCMYAIIWALGRVTHARLARAERERRHQEASMRHQAFHDGLTGLPNRVMFAQDCAQTNKHEAKRLGVLFIDLDRFKPINDSLGHKVGDAVLQKVATRIRKALRSEDRIYRMGGDEFIAVIDTDDLPELEIAAKRVIARLSRAMSIEGVEVHLSASVGIARWPADSSNLEQVVGFADLAMYAAKRAGSGQHAFFEAAMRLEADEQVQLLTGLKHALANEEFVLHYQPRIDAATGEIAGFEALMRWQHPARGLLMPESFIATLEESPLIFEAGTWALEEAARQLAVWHAAGHTAVAMSINMAPKQFRHRDFVNSVERVLRSTGLPPACLELEMTESQLIHDFESMSQTIEQLKRLGVSLSIDDFGTGYSSLAYLQKLRIDCVKIDRSFVRDLEVDADDAKIARTIAKLARSLGMMVVAEGVETPYQAERLKHWGCAQLQGFLYSEAVASTQATALLPLVPTPALARATATETAVVDAAAGATNGATNGVTNGVTAAGSAATAQAQPKTSDLGEPVSSLLSIGPGQTGVSSWLADEGPGLVVA